MRIEKIAGSEERLCHLVAPLVMNPGVIRQNNNYPFKTSARYIWFVAIEDDRVWGFIPVEMKDNCYVINNYYVSGDDPALLAALLGEAVCHFPGKCPLQSVTHTRHLSVFEENGFVVIRTWKLYVKMEYRRRQDSL